MTTTTKLLLELPAGSDLISRTTQLNANWTKVDAAMGAIMCTSITRPSLPFAGMTIYESDTLRTLKRDAFNVAWLTTSNIPVVNTTADVTTPYTGQVVFDLSNSSLKRRTAGGAWVRYPDDTVSTSSQPTSGSTTSTSYTTTLTGGTACGVAFVVPPSGAVMITNELQLSASAGAGLFSLCTIRVCTGAVVGSGTAIVTAQDANAVQVSQNTAGATGMRRTYVSGLTSGNSYNVQQWFKVIGANTMNTLNKELYVENS